MPPVHDDASCTTVYFLFVSFAFYWNRIRHNMIATTTLHVHMKNLTTIIHSDLKLGLAAAARLLLGVLIKMVTISTLT
jgi:hypothetical protein